MKKREKNWLEWLVFTISTLLVVATLGFLLYDAISARDTPPNIQVSLGNPEKKGDHYAVPLKAKNLGAQTAEDVKIEVTAGEGSQSETASIEFPYLPGQSTVEGWITFTQNPAATPKYQIHVLGYGTP